MKVTAFARCIRAVPVAASVVVGGAVGPWGVRPAFACSAPPKSSLPDITFSGVATAVVPGTPYMWTITDDSGGVHVLPVQQLPGEQLSDAAGSCLIELAAPVIGARYAVVLRRADNGAVYSATSNGGSSYTLLLAPPTPVTTREATTALAPASNATRNAPPIDTTPTRFGRRRRAKFIGTSAAGVALALIAAGILRRRRRQAVPK